MSLQYQSRHFTIPYNESLTQTDSQPICVLSQISSSEGYQSGRIILHSVVSGRVTLNNTGCVYNSWKSTGI